jgi:hypothetical protein
MRTITAIYDEIIAEKEQMAELSTLQPSMDSAQTLLDDLTSTSKVAVWRLWVWVMAVAMWIHEKLWEAFRSEVDAIVAAAIPGTAQWYREMCLQYRHGVEMVYEYFKFSYPPAGGVGGAGLIIARASATEVGGNVVLKVAKQDGDQLSKLDSVELASFVEYINKIRFAGTYCQVISADADLLQVSLEVVYDPTVINASGGLLSNPAVYPVKDAINGYIASLPWDGKLRNSALVDAAQAAAGVVDVRLLLCRAKVSGAANWDIVERDYHTVAGWIVLDNEQPVINYESV